MKWYNKNNEQDKDKQADHLQYIQALTGASINSAVKATELAPNNVLNWQTRADTYTQLIPLIGKEAQDFALSSREKVIELEPNNPSGFLALARTYMLMGENEAQMLKAEDQTVKDKAKSNIDNYLKEAENNLNKALELKKDYDSALYNLSLVYNQQGKTDEAIKKMEIVAKQNQLDSGVAFQLGLLYLQRDGEEDLDKAKNALMYAIKLTPSNSNAHWFLASVYEKQGDYDQAIKQIEKVKELNPELKEVDQRLSDLQAGKKTAEETKVLEEEKGVVEIPDGQPTQESIENNEEKKTEESDEQKQTF